MKMKLPFDYNIALIGFMGSGKTTIANCLSKLYEIKTIEMDALIAQREGMSVADIFDRYGEEYFRTLETNLLIEIQEMHSTVISCGGGVPMRRQNVIEMKKNGKIVLLTAAPETIYERVKENHDRPLLENNKSISYISELMEKRREKYEAAADLMIKTYKKSDYEICEEIIEKLKAMNT